MWKIKHIFDGEYGCEARSDDQSLPMVLVTLINENGEERYESVADEWLVKNNLDIGSEWID